MFHLPSKQVPLDLDIPEVEFIFHSYFSKLWDDMVFHLDGDLLPS